MWCQTQYHEGLHGDEQRETQTINTRQVMKGEETGGNTAGTNDETKKVQMNIKHTRHDTIKIKQELINTETQTRVSELTDGTRRERLDVIQFQRLCKTSTLN